MRIIITCCMVMIAGFLMTGCDGGGGSGGGLGKGHDFGTNNSNLVLAVGDSLTVGGYSGGLSWPSRLNQMIDQDVENVGVNGATSEMARESISSLLAANKPGYVIVMLGANDAIRLFDPIETKSNIQSIIGAIKANQSVPVLVNVMDMTGSRENINAYIPGVNESIRQVANEQGVKLVDLNKAAGANPSQYQVEDGLHLNDTGETFVAMEISDLF